MGRKQRVIVTQKMFTPDGVIPATITYVDDERSTAQPGRPPGSTSINYEDVDPFIEYHLDHPTHLRGKTLFDVIRIGYERHNSGTIGDTTIKERIALLKSQRK
jgi:hypothetical protein